MLKTVSVPSRPATVSAIIMKLGCCDDVVGAIAR
jgi:hypothetical protein